MIGDGNVSGVGVALAVHPSKRKAIKFTFMIRGNVIKTILSAKANIHILKDVNICVKKYLFDWLNRIGLTYHSPHKFRHGHAVYALKNAKDISALKAVSQNLMHSTLAVTDGIYAVLSELDVKKQIPALGKDLEKSSNKKELISMLKELIKGYE